MGTFTAIERAKRLVRHLGADLYARTPLFLKTLRGRVVILMYHRVLSEDELAQQSVQPGMFVTAETFVRHVMFLKQYFDVISFDDLLTMWDERRWDADRRYCLITFDDGWLDNYTCAFPILKRYGVPATIFLPTAFIGTDAWFWADKVSWICRQFQDRRRTRQRNGSGVLPSGDSRTMDLNRLLVQGRVEALIEECKRQRPKEIDVLVSGWGEALGIDIPSERQVINWDEAREMSNAGISFGSHSISHVILTEVELNRITWEVQGSRDALKLQKVNWTPVFAYPNGNWSTEIAGAVADAGYRAAATTEFGYEGPVPAHRFALRRVNIHEAISQTEPLFAFHLAGYNNITWR